ncbi:MAG: methyltransferase family protein [Solirubrobacterales bacterium]
MGSDPELVVEGPYRHVRNPMIVAVLTVLVGEGLLLGSPGIIVWAILFFAQRRLLRCRGGARFGASVWGRIPLVQAECAALAASQGSLVHRLS